MLDVKREFYAKITTAILKRTLTNILDSAQITTLRHDNERLKQKVDEQSEQHQAELTAMRRKIDKETERNKNEQAMMKKFLPENINICVTKGTSNMFYISGCCMSVLTCYTIAMGHTVSLQLHSGQYDDLLSWPLQGVVTLLLLHPEDRHKNEELAYHINAMQPQPHVPVKIFAYNVKKNVVSHDHLYYETEYRLLVKNTKLNN